MANDVEHLLICLCACRVSSLMKCPLSLTNWFLFSYYWVLRVLYLLQIQDIGQIDRLQTFLLHFPFVVFLILL